VLRPFLRLDTQAFCFSPAEAEAERNAAKKVARKSPMTPSQAARVLKPDRLRPPRDRYDVEAYRKAIARGCDGAFPPPDHLRPALLPGGKRRESVRAFMARLTSEQRAELNRWRKLHRWHPHRLRHSAATRLRKEYGLDVARAVLGHQSAEITEVYAEMDTTKAIQVMGEVG
jgi:integrase